MSSAALTELVIVRHGETQGNVEQRLVNHLDSPLTEKGRWQAERIAQRMSLEPPQVMYSSNLGRALATAEPIAKACGIETIPCDQLQEYNNGLFAGLTWKEVEEKFPEAHRQYRGGDIDFAPPSGESRREFHQRVVSRLTDILSAHVGSRILVVGHGGTMSVAFRHAMGFPPGQASPARLPNASLNVFEIEDERWVLRTWGDTSHLL